jgi:flagellar basal body-associated protein FliL
LNVSIIVLAIGLSFSCSSNPYAFPWDPSNKEYSPYESVRPQYSYFTNIGPVRTNTRDTVSSTVVVDIILGYDLNDDAAMMEINGKLYELRDFVRSFFRSKTSAELQAENEAGLKQEIMELLNTRIFSSAIIRMIYFNQLEVIEQNVDNQVRILHGEWVLVSMQADNDEAIDPSTIGLEVVWIFNGNNILQTVKENRETRVSTGIFHVTSNVLTIHFEGYEPSSKIYTIQDNILTVTTTIDVYSSTNTYRKR